MEITAQAVLSQLMLGLNNGAFYALLSLGLAVIFGMLNIVNFSHGALYMLGAMVALIGADYLGQWTGNPDAQLSFWWALVVAPAVVGLLGLVIERFMLSRLYRVDPLYGLLFTFGVALMLEGVFVALGFNVSGEPYNAKPESLSGAVNLVFMLFPAYRLFSIVLSISVCVGTWFMIERTEDGRGSDHRRLRRGGDRRHGFDHGGDRDRLRSWHHRGPDQGRVPAAVQYGDLHHHGAGAAVPPGRPVRQGGLTCSRSISAIRHCGQCWLSPG